MFPTVFFGNGGTILVRMLTVWANEYDVTKPRGWIFLLDWMMVLYMSDVTTSTRLGFCMGLAFEVLEVADMVDAAAAAALSSDIFVGLKTYLLVTTLDVVNSSSGMID